MATRLCASFCLDEEVGLYEVDRQIAAANSIPEGAPVGTIARRPDGAWKAERKAGEAGPYWQYSTSAFWQADSPDWNSEDDADSWPVIYDPSWNKSGVIDQLDELICGSGLNDSRELVELIVKYHKVMPLDPTAGDCKRESRSGDEGPVADLGRMPVRWKCDECGEVSTDPTAQQEPPKGMTKLCSTADAVPSRGPEEGFASAQYAEYLRAKAEFETIKPQHPRTPRVVDRLGVDEQGSPWRELLNGWAWVYLYDPKTDRWQRQTPNGRVKRYKPGAEPHRRGPFIEWGDPS